MDQTDKSLYQLNVMCTTRGERRLIGFRCHKPCIKSKLIIFCRLMHDLIKRVMSYFTDCLTGTTNAYNIMCTPAVRAILFKLLTHALQAPMRVNVTSKRIPTHPGINVKSGN